MPDRQPAPDEADDLLALHALLYAGGALPEAETRAFERLLGQDQQAREALGLAVRVVHTSEVGAAVVPHPGYRARVRRRCAAGPWACMNPGRHPVAWGTAGGVAALVLVAVLVQAHWWAGAPAVAVVPAAASGPRDEPAPAGEEHDTAAEVRETEAAHIWAEIPRGEHLHKAHDEARRRAQAEKLLRQVRMDDGRSRLSPSENH